MIGASRAIGIMHGALFAGAPEAGLIGSMLGGVGLVAILVAALVLRPRVPERRGGQSADQY